MKAVKIAAIAAAGLLSAALVMPGEAEAKKAKKCFMAGGDGTAVTVDMAKANAKTALDNLITSRKAKGMGKVKYECSKTMGFVDLCRASQRACG
jgi:hypothetical protein